MSPLPSMLISASHSLSPYECLQNSWQEIIGLGVSKRLHSKLKVTTHGSDIPLGWGKIGPEKRPMRSYMVTNHGSRAPKETQTRV